jgi:uncharacterized membrane protein
MRSVAAVLGGAAVLWLLDGVLEGMLVRALADTLPTDQLSYLAVRNQPMTLALMLVTHLVAALLAGYITGRIAGTQEVRHAMGAGAVLLAVYAGAFLGDNPMLPPVWMRVTMLLVTLPVLVGGASIRAQAREIQSETGVNRPNEGTP